MTGRREIGSGSVTRSAFATSKSGDPAIVLILKSSGNLSDQTVIIFAQNSLEDQLKSYLVDSKECDSIQGHSYSGKWTEFLIHSHVSMALWQRGSLQVSVRLKQC